MEIIFALAIVAIIWAIMWLLFAGVVRKVAMMPDNRMTVEMKIVAEQLERWGRMTWYLEQIGGPECPDGTFAPWQNEYWKEYYALKAEDDYKLPLERLEIIEHGNEIVRE